MSHFLLSSRVMNVAYPNGQYAGNVPNVGFPGHMHGDDNTDALVQHRVQCGHCNESFTVRVSCLVTVSLASIGFYMFSKARVLPCS